MIDRMENQSGPGELARSESAVQREEAECVAATQRKLAECGSVPGCTEHGTDARVGSGRVVKTRVGVGLADDNREILLKFLCQFAVLFRRLAVTDGPAHDEIGWSIERFRITVLVIREKIDLFQIFPQ